MDEENMDELYEDYLRECLADMGRRQEMEEFPLFFWRETCKEKPTKLSGEENEV